MSPDAGSSDDRPVCPACGSPDVAGQRRRTNYECLDYEELFGAEGAA